MEMKNWSDYEKYLILINNSSGKYKIRETYESFLNYKIVIDVINRIILQIKVHILTTTIFIIRK